MLAHLSLAAMAAAAAAATTTAAATAAYMHVEWEGMIPPTAANAQFYHHLPNTTSQYGLVLYYNCEQG